MTHVMLDSSTKREGLPEYDEEVKCPSCDALTMPSFGLAGGGLGPYTMCIECGNVVTKTCEPEDES